MKRNIIGMCAVICAALLIFTGCGSTSKDTETKADNAGATTAAQVAAAETQAAEKADAAAASDNTAGKETRTESEETKETPDETTETPEETTAAPEETTEEAAQDPEAPTTEEAREIMDAVNQIDLLGAGALQCDPEAEYTDEAGYTYYKVVDSRYSSIVDIRSFTEHYLTLDYISQRYSGLLDGDLPMFLDVDGELYMLNAARGGGFDFSDADPVIEKTFEDGYSILAEYDLFGSPETMDINVVKDNGIWKVNNIVFGY